MNALKGAMDDARKKGSDVVDVERALEIGYEEAGRRIGQTMSRDNEHGKFIELMAKQIRPTTKVTLRDGTSFDCVGIGSSRSHRVANNLLTQG